MELNKVQFSPPSYIASICTNENPKKSKTKCMAFLHKKRSLKELTLCGKRLPWVGYVKHLGNTIVNNIDYMSQDTTEKRAQYITRNNELSQEFSFAYPSTKCLINNIFNFTGSSLWNLFNKATEMLEKSCNVSHRIMFSLPRETHIYLIEPISKTKHIKISLMKRYIRFSEMLATSEKKAVRNLLTMWEKTANQILGITCERSCSILLTWWMISLKYHIINYLITSRGVFR